MLTLVLYLPDMTARSLVQLRVSLGKALRNSPLPQAIEFSSADELDAANDELSSQGLGSHLVVRRSEDSRDVSREEAVETVQRSEEFKTLCSDMHVNPAAFMIEVRDSQYCWIVLAMLSSGGIPPGEGFLVDKSTGKVFPRRLVDLQDRDESPQE